MLVAANCSRGVGRGHAWGGSTSCSGSCTDSGTANGSRRRGRTTIRPIIVLAHSIDVDIAAALAHFADIVDFVHDIAGLLHVIDTQVAASFVLALLSQHKESLVRRQLHARDLLQLIWHGDEVDLADVSLACAIIDVTNRNMVTWQKEKAQFEFRRLQ